MAGTLDLWVHGLGEHKASPCLCIPCNQAKVSNSNEERLSVWTTADGVVVVFLLSPFRKVLSCLIYFLFQMSNFDGLMCPCIYVAIHVNITLSKRHNSCNNLFIIE